MHIPGGVSQRKIQRRPLWGIKCSSVQTEEYSISHKNLVPISSVAGTSGKERKDLGMLDDKDFFVMFWVLVRKREHLVHIIIFPLLFNAFWQSRTDYNNASCIIKWAMIKRTPSSSQKMQIVRSPTPFALWRVHSSGRSLLLAAQFPLKITWAVGGLAI